MVPVSRRNTESESTLLQLSDCQLMIVVTLGSSASSAASPKRATRTRRRITLGRSKYVGIFGELTESSTYSSWDTNAAVGSFEYYSRQHYKNGSVVTSYSIGFANTTAHDAGTDH